MDNADRIARDLAHAEEMAIHHYLEAAWSFARSATGAKRPYEAATTIAQVKAAREAFEEIEKARLLAERIAQEHAEHAEHEHGHDEELEYHDYQGAYGHHGH